jgi:hypothetical protein
MQGSTLVDRLPEWPTGEATHLLVEEWEDLPEFLRSSGFADD